MELVEVRDEWEGSLVHITNLPTGATVDLKSVRSVLNRRNAGNNPGVIRILHDDSGAAFAEVAHPSPDFATRAINPRGRIRRGGRTITARLSTPSPRVPYFEVADFASVRCSWGAQAGNKKWNDPSAILLVQTMMKQYGPLDSFNRLEECLPNKHACLVTFRSSDIAKKASREPLPMDVLSKPLSPGVRKMAPMDFTVTQTFGITFAIANSLYERFETDITAVCKGFGQDPNNYCWTYGSDDTGVQGFMHVEARSTQATAVITLRAQIRVVLEGEPVMDKDGLALWNDFLMDPSKQAFLETINVKNNTHLCGDARHERMTVRGSDANREAARQALIREVKKLAATGKRPPKAGAKCVICWDPADRHLKLPCGHSFCKDCLQQHVATLASSSQFPVECAAMDCSHRMAPWFLAKSIPLKDFDRLLRRSVGAYARAHPDRVTYCPTKDCANVFLISRDADKADCHECLAAVCTNCRRIDHPGFTCGGQPESEINEEFAKYRATQGVRDCPHCSAPIDKNGGCPNMFCTHCRRYFDWNRAQ